MHRLRDRDRDAFRADGVVHLPGVLDRTWIGRLERAVAEVVASDAADLSAMADALAGGAASPGRATKRGRFVAGTDHWRRHPVLAELALSSPLPAIAAALLGSERIVLYEDSVLVKEPGTAEATAWHQDIGYFHVEGEQVCTFWCPLDAVTPATGAVRYVAGSHRWGRRFRPNLFVTTDPIPGTEGEDVPDVDAAVDDADLLVFDAEPGDVIVHHAATLHAAGPNASATTSRRAISIRYCGDDAVVRLRPGAPRKPEQASWRDGQRLVDLAGPDFPAAHLP